MFNSLLADSFPTTPLFYVYAALTDGEGDGTITVIVADLDTAEEIYSREVQAHFANRLSIVQMSLRVRDCTFPAAGWYQASILVDGDCIAQQWFRVYQP
jgi:hypothetical protein